MLRGNLAPDGAVLKPSAASPHLMVHRGRAVVFEDIDDYKAKINDEALDIDETCVMVLKNCGPRGYPGMAEVGNMGLPPKVLRKGITDMVRISDARMSGTAYGTVVLHTAPEAARGGPLAVVRTGDMIELDVPGRRLHLDVADAELAAPARGLDAAGAAAGRRLCPALPRPRRRGRHRRRPRLPQGLPRQRRRAGLALMAAPFPVALVGVGKIARDQHIPAIAADPDFELVAGVSRHETDRRRAELPRPRPLPRRGAGGGGGALRAARARTAMALKALAAGRDVLLEKPPAATLGEVDAHGRGRRARTGAVPLRHLALALRAGGGARPRPGSRRGRSAPVAIVWKEDVRRWHPGQAWIWQPARLRRLRPRHQRAVDPDRDPARPVRGATGARWSFPENRDDADRRGASR